MSAPVASARQAGLVDAVSRRRELSDQFFGAEADRITALCQALAERFDRGGRLVAFGGSPADRSDARHVAVEFVHPVIVGKRALPALALGTESGRLADQARLLLAPADIAIAFGTGADTLDALAVARQLGCLTIGCPAPDAEWAFRVPGDDDQIQQEIVETLYHVLWELVHVFLDHQATASAASTAGNASFLYPFLDTAARATGPVTADVHDSVLMKAAEIADLRERTVLDNAAVLHDAAAAMRAAFDAGARLFAAGNGGSATDAMDLVADFRTPMGGGPARPAVDLTEDIGIITALANDIGIDAIYRRQLIAYARARDVLVVLSTSGNSTNIIAALDEARRRQVTTVALVGYDGGRVGAERLADHVIITRSEHIPRIQEAQATAYHLLRELTETGSLREP